MAGDDDDPDYKEIPLIVRELVDFEDDPSTPVLTWRFFLLATIFVALGAFVRQVISSPPSSSTQKLTRKPHLFLQLSFFRTTSVPYSIYFVMVASLYFGRFLARTLPEKEVGFGRFKFQLNPGPFSTKEHVAIVLAASTGASSNLVRLSRLSRDDGGCCSKLTPQQPSSDRVTTSLHPSSSSTTRP